MSYLLTTNLIVYHLEPPINDHPFRFLSKLNIKFPLFGSYFITGLLLLVICVGCAPSFSFLNAVFS